MQLTYLRTVCAGGDQVNKVTAIAFAPNNLKFAVATQDRIIQVFDENGERKDRFSTKANLGPKNYIVKALAFSPDSTKLAVAQSDNIVFVYRLGAEWGEKKSICNKFATSSPVTCVVWPSQHPNELVYGCADGKVKAGNVRTNKPISLYTTPSYVVALACNPEGTGFVSAHLDGSVFRFLFDDGSGSPVHNKLCVHPGVPTALSWGTAVLVASTDLKVALYGADGRPIQVLDYSSDESEKEFVCAAFSPTGDCCALGSFNRVRLISADPHGAWHDEPRDVSGLYTVTAVAWRPDGARLAVAGLTGVCELYDACLRRYRYKGAFEMTYVSPSQVIVKELASGSRIQLRSAAHTEITKVSVFRNRYVVAHTPDSLLVGDMDACQLSEVPWRSAGKEKFFFDNPSVCMVFSAGELALIEYGKNEIVGSIRTEHMNPHLISVRVMQNKRTGEELRRIAYLVDIHTVCVADLTSGLTVTTVTHDARIDWLELNYRATKLLFRDKRRHLHVVDIASSARTTLLDYCAYVQWVPDSDVVVAQNRGSLCVWYSIDAPSRPTLYPIKGEVLEIERGPDRTEVVVDEGGTTASYALDDALISFGAAVESGDLARAAATLDALELTPEVEAMWQSLAQRALEEKNLAIAERCASALGDVARAAYLRHTHKIARYAAEQDGGTGMDHFQVRSRLCVLDKHFREAERILLDQAAVEDAMEMYQELHMFEDAVRVAAQRGHQDLEEMRASYYQYLLQSHQEDRAAKLKEEEGDYNAALSLYLKAAMPARAAALVTAGHVRAQGDVVERVAKDLLKHGLYEAAGDFLERMGQTERALDAYRRGNSFRRAVELARRDFPEQVRSLEEQWGDYYMMQHQPADAIKRYVEANKYMKAMEAAVAAKMWTAAIQIADGLPEADARPVLLRIARSLEDSGDFAAAEKYYVRCGRPEDAVQMHIRGGRPEAAHKLAVAQLGDAQARAVLKAEAEKLEMQGKLKEAERVYLAANEPDYAITMYKKAKRYDDMLRLVGQYHKELLAGTHVHLAKQLEGDPATIAQAEQHYVAGGDWQAAVKMYRARERWDDALRVARTYGGVAAHKNVAYAWATAIGGEAGAKQLVKLGLSEAAIEYLCEVNLWDAALALAVGPLRNKVPEVHYKHAMALEDEGRFAEAETHFVLAGKPKEAVDMYVHERDWAAALRVAEAHEPASVTTVLLAQAKHLSDQGDAQRAEQLYIRAGRPEMAVRMYMEARAWKDALRVANEHVPQMAAEVHAEYEKATAPQAQDATNPASMARLYESRGDYARAIDSYLKLTREHNRDPDYLEEMWENAVRLAMNYVPDRAPDVVGVVTQRLVEIKRFDQAAELWLGLDRFKEAIDVYCRSGQVDKARRVAAQMAPQLSEYVEKLAGDARAPAIAASVAAAAAASAPGGSSQLESLVAQDRWPEVMSLAAAQGAAVEQKYAVVFAARMLTLSKIPEAVAALAKHGAAPDPAHFELYSKIARAGVAKRLFGPVRDMLYRLVTTLAKGGAAPDPLQRLLMLAHYAALKETCATNGLTDVAAKLAVSLLRYVGDIPADLAFYQAGLACRQSNLLSMAFVFWNRFLDISDAMNEDSSAYLDNGDFVETDIPYDFPIPTESSVSEAEHEDAHAWIMQISVSKTEKVEQSLPTRTCERCNQQTYEASLTCHSCKNKSDACIVTGWPVLKGTRIACKSCNKPANRPDWNKFVAKMKVCPWCASVQNPIW